MKHILFITGGAGYVGAMLCDQFAKRDDVELVITLDKEKESDLLKNNINSHKIIYIHANMSDNTWQEKVRGYNPDVVVHTAWQIRTMFGKSDLQWKWNVIGSDNVFDLAFSLPSVKKLIYFSTVSSYGAFKENKLDHFIKETQPFVKTEYLYAEEKRVVEENLKEKYNIAKVNGSTIQVAIVRPAAITGPRGRFGRVRFGLQAALSGQLKGRGSFVYSLISFMVSFMPVTKGWLRQFIHEDDVCDIVDMFVFSDKLKSDYDVFNICPSGKPVLGPDMARAVKKKTILLHPQIIRVVFFIFWYLFRGRVPTSEGGWKFYSYPIAVDGSKLTEIYGYKYKWESKEAFIKNEGRYKVILDK